MDLARCNVLVTGATGGIGRATVAALASAGARVLATGRHQPALDALRNVADGGRVTPFAAELIHGPGRARLAAAARALPGGLQAIVHAAGAGEFGIFDAQHAGGIERLVDTNLVAPMLLTHELLPDLDRNAQAAVLVVGSTFGAIGHPGFASYSASKFGLRGWCEAMARERRGGRVRFLYLSPRATRTAFNPPALEAANRALGVATDPPERVAQAIVESLRRGRARHQLGMAERLFVRINALLPGLVDRAIARQLPTLLAYAHPGPQPTPAGPPRSAPEDVPTAIPSTDGVPR